MKVRRGFVSNSSSTSFVIETKLSVDKFKEKMEILFKALKGFGFGIEGDELEEIMTIYNIDSDMGNDFIKTLKEWKSFCDGSDHFDVSFNTKNSIVIDSVYDNSIPEVIQEIIEGLPYSVWFVDNVSRYHFG